MERKDFTVYYLYGLYGTLLTEKQQEIIEDYFGLDLSLGEIAEIRKISRQAVNDALCNAKEQLFHYEEKLKTAEKIKKICKILERLEKCEGEDNAENNAVQNKNGKKIGEEIKKILEITEGK